MIEGTTIIDADGHIMDWDDVVRPYMPEPYRRRALFYPLENWDRDLGGTLGKHRVRDLDTRLADMDRQQIDVSVLYPTVGLMLGQVRDAVKTFCDKWWRMQDGYYRVTTGMS